MDHHEHQERHGHAAMGGINAMAASATLHCLTGCAIGEIAGLMIGTAAGLANGWTIALSVALAFVFGYTLSTLPLVKAGLSVGAALTRRPRRRHAVDRDHGGRRQPRDGGHPGRHGRRPGQRRLLGRDDDRADGRVLRGVPGQPLPAARGKGHALLHEHHQAAQWRSAYDG